MSAFFKGYKTFSNLAGANEGVFIGGQYVTDVECAINELTQDISNLRFNVDGQVGERLIPDLKGRAAEYWHKGTFNIDAAVKGNLEYVSKVPERGREGLGDPDLEGTWGDKYGLKYDNFADKSAKQQAKSVWDRYKEYEQTSREPISYDDYVKNLNSNNRNAPFYEGQYRLIPSDQLEDAKKWLTRKINESSAARQDQVARYKDALDMLTDRIKNAVGVESIPLTEAEAKEIAVLLKEGKFDPAKFGITTEELIRWQNIMEQAFSAGLTAAVISVVLEVAPELINIITKLVRDGKVDVYDFKRLGFSALRGGTLGYVRGTIASALTIASKAGKLGLTLKNANPALIGAAVALTMSTLQNAVLVSFGKMTKREFADRCTQDLTVTSYAMAFGIGFQRAFGAMLNALLPQLPVLAFLLGSFIGSAVGSFIYRTMYSCVLSYCIESGCTFFGLVEQDYTVSEDILRKIGLHVFEYEKFLPKQVVLKRFEVKKFTPKQFEPHKTSITVLRRGVIKVMCVGYA